MRDREREKEGVRELHARTSRKCGHAESLSVPHSVSQSACVIIILILNLLSSFPSSGIWAWYRNPIEKVAAFLNEKHPGFNVIRFFFFVTDEEVKHVRKIVSGKPSRTVACTIKVVRS